MQDFTLIPAYGRDYRTGKAARLSFFSGEDWQVANLGPSSGRYCSARDFPLGTRIELRFNNSRNLCAFIIGGKEARK